MSRSGRAGTAIALTLFMVSALAMFPILSRINSIPREADEDFVIKTDSTSSQDGGVPKIKHWRSVEEIDGELAQFETVFWEADDTSSLRKWLAENDGQRVVGASVLEIGTGTGLVALVCKKLGAEPVIATDINPAAIACARYNSMNLDLAPIDFRQVANDEPAAFAVIGDNEKFDWIVSNPPWEDAPVTEVAAHALYDPNFTLLDSLLVESAVHLKPGGHVLLAYGAKTAIVRIIERAPTFGWTVKIHDERELESLPEVFLPGMLLELTRASK